MAGIYNSYNEYLAKVRGSESGGKQYAKNPRSTASGLYQFTESTWKGLGYDWKDRFNPTLQNQAMAKLTNYNANYLKSKLGITPTDADLYGAHFLGPQGYTSVYNKPNNTPLSSVLTKGAMSANPFLAGKTTGFLKSWLSKKMNVSVSPSEVDSYEREYGVDTSINLPMNTGEYQTAPEMSETTTKGSLEAEQAKAELLEKQREKDFLAELQATQEQNSETRYQQEQQAQQQQQAELDPSYYQVPQIELPNYEAIKYQQAQNQAQIPQDEFQRGGKKYSEQNGRLVVTTKVVNTPNGPRYYQAKSPDYNFSIELTDAKRVGDSIPKANLDPHIIEALNRRQDGGEIDLQYKDGGGIPERYKNMGFTRVGQKKEGDGQKKWKVLAKKGDKYKVVQGGYRGMKDFSQHGSKKRQDNFWSRMGGRDSAKANDPFSPLYWHKRLGKWEDGGEIEGEVECTNCGWSWDKSESTEKDMYNCHKCGGKSTGELLSQFQQGGAKEVKSALGAGKFNTTTGGTVIWGTPEYEAAYNRGEVVTDKGVRSEVTLEGGQLDEVVVKGKKRGFWEQSRDKYLKEHQDDGLLGAIGSVATYPLAVGQHALTYGTTGKVQDPDEAWGYNTNEGWFDSAGAFGRNLADAGLNIGADPSNLVGAGIVTKGKGFINALTKGKALSKGIARYGDDLIQASKAAGKIKLPTYSNAYRWQADVVPESLVNAGRSLTPEQQSLTGSWYTHDVNQLPFYMRTRPGSGNVNVSRLSDTKIANLESNMSDAARGMSGKTESVAASNTSLPGELILPKSLKDKVKQFKFDVNPSEYPLPSEQQELLKDPSFIGSPYHSSILQENTSNIVNPILEAQYQPIMGVPRKYFPFKEGGEAVEQFQLGGRKKNPFATNQKNTNYSFFPTVGSIEKTLMEKTGITGFRKKAQAKAQAQGIKGSHNGGLDAVRHAASSAKTASLLPPGLGFIAANTLGAAHEVDRKMNWRETASDLYNNFAGSLIGSIPFIDDEDRQDLVIEAQKRGFLHNVNKLEEGGEFAEEEMDYGQNDFALPNQDQEQGNPVWPQTPQPINPIWSQPVQPIKPVWPQTPQPINPIWAQPVQRKPVKKAEKPKTTVTRKPSKYEYLFEKNNSKKVDTRDFVVPKFNGIKEGSGNSSQEILNYQQEKNKKVFQEEVKKQEESKAAKELSDFRKEITSKAILEDAIENDEIGLDINNYRTEKDVMNLQKMLTEKGYNLNPQGKFANNGIDGKLGNVTKNAMIKYNQHNSDSGYESIKEGTGFIGDCQESQCSEYMQNELFRNVQPKVSREDWNKKTGLFGDAWNIGENIIKSGGKKVEKGEVKPGDVVTMFTGGRSPFQSQANAAGSGTTHTGLVDKVNPDGSYYILHNNHSTNLLTGDFEGKEYRDLVKDGVIVSGGAKRSFTVRGTFRPDYKEVQLGEKKILRDDVKLFLDPKKAVVLSSKEYDNNFTSANAKNKLLNTFIKPLNDTRNKKTISKVFGLGDDEYQSLSKLTLGILGQETSFGTNAKYTTGTKEAGAIIAKLVGYKSDEASKGAGRLKYETNFGSDDLTELGITQDNFDDEDKAPLTTMYKLATDYKKFLKKGYNKKDAMYRAVTVYNVSLGHVSQGKKVEDWAKNYDVDYTNKVLNYSTFFNIGDNKKQYKTTTDELLLHPNVYKWREKLKKEKKL
jgi:hypothetical protein